MRRMSAANFHGTTVSGQRRGGLSTCRKNEAPQYGKAVNVEAPRYGQAQIQSSVMRHSVFTCRKRIFQHVLPFTNSKRCYSWSFFFWTAADSLRIRCLSNLEQVFFSIASVVHPFAYHIFVSGRNFSVNPLEHLYLPYFKTYNNSVTVLITHGKSHIEYDKTYKKSRDFF